MADRDIIRINCGFCDAALGVDADDFSGEGKGIFCPRCHKSFFLQRSRFERDFEYSMHCPKCGELQKVSDECIYCNVIVSKFLKHKGLEQAWDALSRRFAAKNPPPAKAGPQNAGQDLMIKCPYCGFSKRLTREACPSYITRIGCPKCSQGFDIINWMDTDK